MNPTSLRHKGVVPLASVRAVLRGWRLRFNVHHWFRHEGGVGNIVPAGPDDRVEGVLHRIEPADLTKLDRVESYGVGYDRIEVEVEAEGRTVRAIAYVGLPDYLDEGCLPTRRYLNILVEGARTAGVTPDYLRWLEEHPVYEHPPVGPFQPPPGSYPSFTARTLPATHTALAGHAFDMDGCRWEHRCLIELLGGRDMTLFHLRRMDTSDGSETLADVAAGRFSPEQRAYLDAYLAEYDREYRYAGRFIYTLEDP